MPENTIKRVCKGHKIYIKRNLPVAENSVREVRKNTYLFLPVQQENEKSPLNGTVLEAFCFWRFRVIPVRERSSAVQAAESLPHGMDDLLSVFLVIIQHDRPHLPVTLRIITAGIQRNTIGIHPGQIVSHLRLRDLRIKKRRSSSLSQIRLYLRLQLPSPSKVRR